MYRFPPIKSGESATKHVQIEAAQIRTGGNMPLCQGKVQISPYLRAPLGTLSAKGAEGVYTGGWGGKTMPGCMKSVLYADRLADRHKKGSG